MTGGDSRLTLGSASVFVCFYMLIVYMYSLLVPYCSEMFFCLVFCNLGRLCGYLPTSAGISRVGLPAGSRLAYIFKTSAYITCTLFFICYSEPTVYICDFSGHSEYFAKWAELML